LESDISFEALHVWVLAFGLRQISLAKCSHSSFTLVVSLLCAGEDLPPSNDVDEGFQWEVQTDESWIPY
jgi:hypothetical protein